jgi:hypothetical protein
MFSRFPAGMTVVSKKICLLLDYYCRNEGENMSDPGLPELMPIW